ncbi:MAG TPA: hypothetical protein PKD61_04460 [Polyangiaceae bacterium]|nr:hypothetical protein [Polyangiaceae bacterium]
MFAAAHHVRMSTHLNAHEKRKIAVLAAVDPRTIDQYLKGKAKSTTSSRITDALRQMGRFDLLRIEAA